MKTAEFALYVGASEQVCRRWFRKGLPGVRRDAEGNWQVDDPAAAAAAWRANADFSKASPEVRDRAVSTGRASSAWGAIPAAWNSRYPGMSQRECEEEATVLLDLRDRLAADPEDLDDNDFERLRCCVEECWSALMNGAEPPGAL